MTPDYTWALLMLLVIHVDDLVQRQGSPRTL